MMPIKLTKKSKSKLSLKIIELESNEFNNLDLANTYPWTNLKDDFDEINFENTNNLEIIDNLKTEKDPVEQMFNEEVELQENNIKNDNNNKNNEDTVSIFNQFDIGSNSIVNVKEKTLAKKRFRKEKEKIQSPINNNSNLYIKINNDFNNKNNFRIANEQNKFHPPFKDVNDGLPLKLFDNKKSNSINKKIFKKKFKIIHK